MYDLLNSFRKHLCKFVFSYEILFFIHVQCNIYGKVQFYNSARDNSRRFFFIYYYLAFLFVINLGVETGQLLLKQFQVI